ncbi:DNA integrity scanning protein DisA [uncultured archaeon]|nr:DNA integrity scanning protein DisA [uncultured archaeon]
MKQNDQAKELEECLIKIGLKIAKRNEGALFVVGKTKYSPLVEQAVPKFKAQKNPKLLESLALMDGAVILDKDGTVKAYGARIKSSTTFKNHGTRHAAALGASKEKGNICILVSEEDKKIRIFKNGKMIMQIDPKEKNVESSISPAADILETIGAGTLGTIGASILAPGLGITLLPGVVVFGAVHYFGKKLLSKN